jgi:hypothetical protein
VNPVSWAELISLPLVSAQLCPLKAGFASSKISLDEDFMIKQLLVCLPIVQPG